MCAFVASWGWGNHAGTLVITFRKFFADTYCNNCGVPRSAGARKRVQLRCMCAAWLIALPTPAASELLRGGDAGARPGGERAPASLSALPDSIQRLACPLPTAPGFSALHELHEYMAHHNRTSERPLIIGAGEGRTGTRSVAVALREMGLRVMHWNSVAQNLLRLSPTQLADVDWPERLASYDAVLDTPIPDLTPFLLAAFPNARVILTERDALEWSTRRSAAPATFSTYFASGSAILNSSTQEHGLLTAKQAKAGTGGNHNLANLFPLALLFSAHNLFVRCSVPPQNYMEMSVFSGSACRDDFVEKLAEFVGAQEVKPGMVFPGCTASPKGRAAQPLVYLHFHKAGGTTACSLVRTGGLTVNDADNCNCNDDTFQSALRAGDGASVARYMQSQGLDACFVEHVQWWPEPRHLAAMREHVRLATTLRDPWARLRSNYERDSTLCGGCANYSFERYVAMQGCYPRPFVQLPDFYVRTLTGKVSPRSIAALSDSDLAAAIRTLQMFDQVNILEHADFAERISALTPTPLHRGSASGHQLSNNAYSNQPRSGLPPCLQEVRNNEAGLRTTFQPTINNLDFQLYEWAVNATEPLLPASPPAPSVVSVRSSGVR